jgi:hypothetical protein
MLKERPNELATAAEFRDEDFKHCFNIRTRVAFCGYTKTTFSTPDLPILPPPNACPICLALWKDHFGML